MKPSRKKNPKARVIRGLLYINGSSPTAVSRDLDLNLSHVVRVIDGERESERVKNHIARITGKSVRWLWAA